MGTANKAMTIRTKIRAYTLFEVIFSLGLILVLMTLIGTAINTHLNTQFQNRMHVEEGQLARALLNRIAADIRAVVLDPVTDEDATADDAEAAAEDELGESDSTTSELDEDATYSDYYNYENEIIGTKKGIYGGIDWIQIDTMRTIPGERFAYNADDYAYSRNEDEEYLPKLDLLDCGQKTVLYYLGYDSGTADADEEYLQRLKKTSVAPVRPQDRGGLLTSDIKYGLYSREMNRMIVDYALEAGLESTTNMSDYDEHLAPEVERIEFYYYVNDDPNLAIEEGEWLEEWDMDIEGELPRAVEIRLYLRRKGYKPSLTGGLMSNENERERVVAYSLIVPLSRELVDLSETEETTETETSEAY